MSIDIIYDIIVFIFIFNSRILEIRNFYLLGIDKWEWSVYILWYFVMCKENMRLRREIFMEWKCNKCMNLFECKYNFS